MTRYLRARDALFMRARRIRHVIPGRASLSAFTMIDGRALTQLLPGSRYQWLGALYDMSYARSARKQEIFPSFFRCWSLVYYATLGRHRGPMIMKMLIAMRA